MSQVAVQMYTVRNHTKTVKDLVETLRKISKIGYQAIQAGAFPFMTGESPEMTAADLRKLLDDHGIRCVATHSSWESLVNETEKEIEFHEALDCDYTAIGMIPKPYQDKGASAFRQFISDAEPVIRRLKKAGIRFGYHNHAYEFLRDKDGTRPIDVLVNEGGPGLMMEVDTYWVAHAGGNPTAFLKRCAGRIDVIHVKDKVMVDRKESFFAPIGEGNLEWDEIIAAARAGGCEWHCVEQDLTWNDRDPFDCLRSSFEFLTGKGL